MDDADTSHATKRADPNDPRILARTRLISPEHGDKAGEECPPQRQVAYSLRVKSFEFFKIVESNGSDIEVAIALLSRAAFAIARWQCSVLITHNKRSKTCSLVSFVTTRVRT